MSRVYLDHHSATPVDPEVFEAMRPWFTERYGNPSSPHGLALQARRALEHSREQLARLINAEVPEQLIFTSGGTESANLAVLGAARANQRLGNHILVAATEHPAILNAAKSLVVEGFEVTEIPVDSVGRIDPEQVEALATDKTILACVHHANHDIGTLQPIADIGARLRQRGVPLFVDATTSGGWTPLDVQALNATFVSLTPHRFYGPKGIGVLYRHRSGRVKPILHGGMQEDGRRPGTENVPAIVGAGAAAELAIRELPQREEHCRRLQQRLWTGLRESISHLRLNGPKPGPQRLATNLNVSCRFVEGEGIALRCDMRGLAINSGTGCVIKSMKVPHVLAALGLTAQEALGAILLTLGRDNTPEDVDFAVTTISQAVADLREMSASWETFQKQQRP